jgi:hypothetical protein
VSGVMVVAAVTAATAMRANARIENNRGIFVRIPLRDVTHEIAFVRWHTSLRCILMTAGDELK